MKNNILLTGASGFLGSIVLKELQTEGHHVFTLGRSGTSDFVSDLSASVPDFKNTAFDTVIHAAGKAHIVPTTEAERQDFFDVNVKGTKHLCEAIDKLETAPKYFVFISTVAVYGRDEGQNIDEEHPLNGNTPYAQSKIQSETFLQQWAKERNIKLTILRLPLIVAENAPGNLGRMMNGIQSGKYFGIGSGDAKKSMVLARDVAKAVTKVAEKGGIYNLTDGYHPTFSELEEVLARRYNKKKPAHIPSWIAAILAKVGDFIPRSPFNTYTYSKMAATLTFSDDKARKEWGWQPKQVLDYLS